ncbi:hypothetical protein PCE1_000704 [Barthelona sp. PCE]
MLSLGRYVYRKIIQQEQRNVALFGLSSGGKTSLLNYLSNIAGNDRRQRLVPTVGVNLMKLKFPSVEVSVYDLGGGSAAVDRWHNYYDRIHGIFYVVDSSECIENSMKIFDELRTSERLRDVFIALCFNKKDRAETISCYEMVIEKYLEDPRLEIFETCTLPPSTVTQSVNEEFQPGVGVREAVEWMNESLVTTSIGQSRKEAVEHTIKR